MEGTVGAGNALDAGDGAVGVHVEVHGGHARHVDVLCGDLATGAKLPQDLVVRHKTALAMGDGHGVELVRVALGQPGRKVTADAGANQAALVAADLVEGQRGGLGRGVHDVAVGHEAQLDERLEAVADAEHQAIAR